MKKNEVVPNISIIIPTYNRAHLIERAINSVLAQSYRDWELIIVDDGSSDNTDSVINSYASDPRVKYIKKENTGAAHSRNVGVDNCESEIITFIDSDDEANENWLESLVKSFHSDSVGVVCCGAVRKNSNGEYVGTSLPYKLGQCFCDYEGLFIGGSFALRKKIFQDITGYDSKLKSGQHTELALRIAPYLKEHGLEVIPLSETLITIHIHDGERIRHNHTSVFEGTVRILEKHEKALMLDMNNYKVYLRVAIVNGIKTDNRLIVKMFMGKLMNNFKYDYKTWVLYFRLKFGLK